MTKDVAFSKNTAGTMMDALKLMAPAAVALISALLVQWLIFHKWRKETADRYTSMYLQSQLTAYQELWALLEPTTRYHSPTAILYECAEATEFNVENAKQFCDQLTSFFFSKHGLFLRPRTRKALFATRARLAVHIERAENTGPISSISTDRKSILRKTFAELQETIRLDARITERGFALTRRQTLE